MTALPNDHARYLAAELDVLATELRNPRSSLTRLQLVALAERARDDAARLSSRCVEPNASPARIGPLSSAKIIPFFRP